MNDPVSAAELHNALRTFVGYLQDLERVDFDGSQTKLRLVINYSQKDPVVRCLAEMLRTRLTTQAVMERVEGERFDVPRDPRDRLGFLYTVLYQVKHGRLDLRQLLTRPAFSGASLNDRWRDCQRQVVAPLRGGVSELRGWVEAHVGDDGLVPDEVLSRAVAAHGPAEVEPAPPPAASPAAPRSGQAEPAPEVGPLTELKHAVREAGLGREDEDDLALDARILELERGKAHPSRERLEELVAAFAAVSPALAAAARAAAGLPGPAPAAEKKPPAEKKKATGKKPAGEKAAAKKPAAKKKKPARKE